MRMLILFRLEQAKLVRFRVKSSNYLTSGRFVIEVVYG